LRGRIDGRAELVELLDTRVFGANREVAGTQAFSRVDQRIDRSGQSAGLPPSEESGDCDRRERGQQHEEPRLVGAVADNARRAARTQRGDDLLVTVEAHHEGGRTDVEAAVKDLNLLLSQYCETSPAGKILDKNNPKG